MPSRSPTILDLPAGRTDAGWWRSAVRHVQAWAGEERADLRDAIWLLPYSALLPVARRAWSAAGGWQPRIETLATLRDQVGPRLPAAGPGPDPVLNRLQAVQWLREQPAAAAWARQEPRAFRDGIDALVRCAQSLQAAAACLPPEGRVAWWQAVRAAIGCGQGPGAVERLLARVAIEWAASSPVAEADALRLLRPSAWVVLRAGGADPLADALLAEAAAQGIPGLVLDADPPPDGLFRLSLAGGEPPAEAVCTDAEAEAQAACAQVLADLAQPGDGPVALIAQDREAVRRVRALLERFGVTVVDDTGWRLATTRAAARLMALLRAAQGLRPGRADSTAADQRLDWLKGDPLGLAHPQALAALEARWRGRRVPEAAVPLADALWADAQARLAPLLAERRLPLAAWLARLGELCLADEAEAARWRDDVAGRAVLAALRIEPVPAGAWAGLAQQVAMTLDDLVAWVDEVLAEASFVPPHDAEAPVVITPLARAMLRPFGAVVFPGCDEQRLGGVEPQAELLSPALVAELGLEGLGARREREALAFAQLLRQPRVTLLRRAAEGSEPLGASPLVERLRLAWQAAPGGARALPLARPALPTQRLAALPVQPPAPQATARWPAGLSASAVEALRACPYRFYSRVFLGLGEADELDRLPAKRDYGNWLHSVLWRFHDGRMPTTDIDADRARLRTAVADEQAASPHAESDLLPFLASFEALAERYLAWLHRREAEGWHFLEGEAERRITPPALGGVALQGRLDRVDRHADGRLLVLDYKTGSLQSLKDKLADRSEDTQLAFYVALVADEGPTAAMGASYLAMDDRNAPAELTHAKVGESAVMLVERLGGELQRLREGEPLRALGQGELCDHCEARGLCRRDHWAPDRPDTPQ